MSMDQHYRQALSQYIGQDIHLRTSLIYHINPSFVVSTSWWRATTSILRNHSDSRQDLLVPFLTTLDHMTYRALGRHIEPPWYLEQFAILLHHLVLVTALTHCSTHKRHPLPYQWAVAVAEVFFNLCPNDTNDQVQMSRHLHTLAQGGIQRPPSGTICCGIKEENL